MILMAISLLKQVQRSCLLMTPTSILVIMQTLKFQPSEPAQARLLLHHLLQVLQPVHGKASTLPVIHLQILNLLIVIFCTQECRGNLLFILRSQLELPLLHTMNGFLSSRCSIMGLLECFEITGRGIHKPGNSRKALHFSLNGRQPS